MGAASKIRLIILAQIVSLSACSNQNGTVAQDCLIPKEVDSLKVVDLYTDAMWFIYCNYCDIKCDKRLIKGIPDITYGQADLKLLSLDTTQDSVFINFEFYYNDLRLPYVSSDTNIIISGLVYRKSNKKIIALMTHGWLWDYQAAISGSSNPRMKEPLQKEVVQYIINNKHGISRQFFCLARRNKIIQ
jgi:hypothetical protein